MALKARKKPYDPLASPYKTQSGFNRAVRLRAKAQIQPTLNDIHNRMTETTGAHTTRNNELQGWYGYAQNAGQAGNDALNTQLQQLASSARAQGGASGAALAAAIQRSSQGTADAAAGLGVAAPNADPGYTDAAKAYAGAGDLSLGGDVTSLLGRASAQQGILGLSGLEAGQAEGRRYDAANQALMQERTQARAQLGPLRAQTREQMIQDELARSGQAFQQGLAQQQFGLDTAQFGESKKQNRFQNQLAKSQLGETKRSNQAQEGLSRQQQANQYAVDQGNLAIQQQQFTQDVANARDKQTQQVAQDRADAFNNGVAAMQKWLAPTKAEQRKNGTTKSTYKRKFQDAYMVLTRQMGLPPNLALKVLGTFPTFQGAAEKYLRIRKKKNPTTGDPANSPFEQGSGHTGPPY